jgi:hypothetical protein
MRAWICGVSAGLVFFFIKLIRWLRSIFSPLYMWARSAGTDKGRDRQLCAAATPSGWRIFIVELALYYVHSTGHK